MGLVFMVAALLVAFGTALAEDVKVKNDTISIDFGSDPITTAPITRFVAGGLGVEGIRYTGTNLTGRVLVGTGSETESHPILVGNCADLLERVMKQEFINVVVTPYEDGFIGTGEDLDRHEAYGILKPVDVEFGRAAKLLIVTAISPDEEVGKRIVSSVEMGE